MKLHIITLALDAMPFLPMQLACFNRLELDWKWHIVEGVAANVNCTGWCKAIESGLSEDGSHQFIQSLARHPRVHVRWSKLWTGGKVEMCNAAIEHMHEPAVLMQIDADEIWEPWQLESIFMLMNEPGLETTARFYDRYFVGPNIVTVGENCYGNNPGEFLRAWKFQPGMKFARHEPPVMIDCDGKLVDVSISRDQTRNCELVFDHYAYAYESQVAFKERYYGYTDAVRHWRRLQSHVGPWPVKLKDFLPWVDDRAQADLLHKPTIAHIRNPGDGQP